MKLHDNFVQAPDLGEILFQTRLQDAVAVFPRIRESPKGTEESVLPSTVGAKRKERGVARRFGIEPDAVVAAHCARDARKSP